MKDGVLCSRNGSWSKEIESLHSKGLIQVAQAEDGKVFVHTTQEGRELREAERALRVLSGKPKESIWLIE
jgi:DNA-binding MarR family transcriptional regulator